VKKLKIGCVSYTNSFPFIYGLKNHADPERFELFLDNPAECYRKLENAEIDIGLSPVIALKKLPGSRIISPYCIGSHRKVRSVILCSHERPEKLNKIYLDYQSRASVEMVKILCKYHWKTAPEFIHAREGFEEMDLEKNSGKLIIGDRSFPCYKINWRITDLAASWWEYSGKPFVFACWISRTELPIELTVEFEKILEKGVNTRSKVIEYYRKHFENLMIDPEEYYFENINYYLDESSVEGMELFLNLLQ
jgi:chorismate dehydratase